MLTRRRSGLTALAILNFVLGGLVGLRVLGFAGYMTLRAFDGARIGWWLLILLPSALIAGLLIAGGVGYLRSRHWARTVANVYAGLAVAVQLVAAIVVAEVGGGLGGWTVLQLGHAIATLVLVNTTFKSDLVTRASDARLPSLARGRSPSR